MDAAVDSLVSAVEQFQATMQETLKQTTKFSYGWCFTVFTADLSVDDLTHFFEAIQTYVPRFICMGLEHAPSTGREHYQGYCRFAVPVSFPTVRDWFRGKAHVEAAKGSDVDNLHYCSKESLVVNVGTPIQPAEKGLKNAIVHILQEIQKGTPDSELRMMFPVYYFLYQKRILSYRLEVTPMNQTWIGPNPKDRHDLKRKNFWIWGPPGTGKTRWARDLAPALTFAKNVSKWWDGYNPWQHKIVVIDDWPGQLDKSVASALCQHLKLWGDRYPVNAEIKGGTIPLVPGTYFLIVTSNYDPKVVFSPEDYEAIFDRFSVWAISGKDDVRLTTKLDFRLLTPLQ